MSIPAFSIDAVSALTVASEYAVILLFDVSAGIAVSAILSGKQWQWKSITIPALRQLSSWSQKTFGK